MSDARGDDQADAGDAWGDVTAGFVDLGTRLRGYFDAVPDDEAGDEMRSAWTEFTEAAQRLGRSVTTAFQDEEVQEGAKKAFGTLIDAVGKTVRDAGEQFSWDPHSETTAKSDHETEDVSGEDTATP